MKPSTAHVKGTDIVAIKGMLKSLGEDRLRECFGQLSPTAQKFFETVVPTTWIPNALATEIMDRAAKILFPGVPDDLERLGAACAENAFGGIYKVFLRVTSVSFLIKNVPLVWSMYHSVGKAEVDVNRENNGAILVVTGAPDVSIKNLRLVGGFSMRALEMAGAKNVSCRLNSGDPRAWAWTFAWTLGGAR
jgi:hypothetical protein